MTEQVIDIRDRIEKMRNQMTVPNPQEIQKHKKNPANDFSKVKDPSQSHREAVRENQKLEEQIIKPNIVQKEESHEIEVSKIKTVKTQNVEKEIHPDKISKIKEEKAKSHEDISYTQYSDTKKSQKESFKKYDDYQNDRVVDENKQSVKLDEKQPFPQFSLNVSNPISWKLMLLIMLMQLLTNMMLVIVLYLK